MFERTRIEVILAVRCQTYFTVESRLLWGVVTQVMVAIASPWRLNPTRRLWTAAVAWMSLPVSSIANMSNSEMALGDTRGKGEYLD
jgi:hypothetical protein